MPLDIVNTTLTKLNQNKEHVLTADELLIDDLNFDVEFEPTKWQERKYVINGNTGEYLGIVGKDFKCASHPEFFVDIHDAVTEHLGEEQCDSMNIRYKTARNNAWALMDMTLPNVTAKIVTSRHETTVGQRIIAMHGIDGSCSNQVYFGAIDFFCTNGMVTGEHDKIRRKNTSNFNMDSFIAELKTAQQDFYSQSEQLQHWARKDTSNVDVLALLESIMNTRKAEKMFSLYNQEVAVRGRNVFALYSAFTNQATFADERNGFKMRNTGNDTGAETMWKREHDVAKWISTPQFRELVAA